MRLLGRLRLEWFCLVTPAADSGGDLLLKGGPALQHRDRQDLSELVDDILGLAEVDSLQRGPELELHVLNHATNVSHVRVDLVDWEILLVLLLTS